MDLLKGKLKPEPPMFLKAIHWSKDHLSPYANCQFEVKQRTPFSTSPFESLTHPARLLPCSHRSGGPRYILPMGDQARWWWWWWWWWWWLFFDFFVLIVVHIFGGSLHFLCLSWLAVFKWKSALGLSQNGQVTWWAAGCCPKFGLRRLRAWLGKPSEKPKLVAAEQDNGPYFRVYIPGTGSENMSERVIGDNLRRSELLTCEQ